MGSDPATSACPRRTPISDTLFEMIGWIFYTHNISQYTATIYTHYVLRIF